MHNLIIIANLVAPVFLIVALGYFLRILGVINDNFVKLSSKLVFNVSLPALVFMEVSRINISGAIDIKLVGFAYVITIFVFGMNWLISRFITKNGKDKAAFIQGSFRGNFAVIGLALIASIFGNDKLGKASLLLAFMIPMFNVLSVIALTVPVRKEKQLNISKTFIEIIKNPLILAVIFALPFSYFHIKLNSVFLKTGNYLADLALPLALIGIGGFLNFKDVKRASGLAFTATFLKLIVVPSIAAFAAFKLGFMGDDLGILFILFAVPTAIASFIMADAMGVNSKLAGNILLITTLCSVVTITLGLFILKQNGLI